MLYLELDYKTGVALWMFKLIDKDYGMLLWFKRCRHWGNEHRKVNFKGRKMLRCESLVGIAPWSRNILITKPSKSWQKGYYKGDIITDSDICSYPSENYQRTKIWYYIYYIWCPAGTTVLAFVSCLSWQPEPCVRILPSFRDSQKEGSPQSMSVGKSMPLII